MMNSAHSTLYRLLILCLGLSGLAAGWPLSDGVLRSPNRNFGDLAGAKKELRWKTYFNERFNFSVDYPPGWSLQEGGNRAGMDLKPMDKAKFHLIPEMGAGGAIGQPSKVDERCCQTLEEQFEENLAALREYGHGRNIIVVSKKNVEVQGLPAIDSSIRYEDSSTGGAWFDRTILIHARDNGLSYNVELRCSPPDVEALMPLFDRMRKSFRILGPPA